MSTMNTPEFNAEALLYNASVRFPKARAVDELTSGQKIIPLREVDLQCLGICQTWPSRRDYWRVCCH